MNNLDEIRLHIANTLKRIRTEKKVTQKELGDYLGVGDSAISAWERGQNKIDMTYLVPICKYLGVSIKEFETESTPEISLSEKEKELILNFRKLSQENKNKVTSFIEMAKE